MKSPLHILHLEDNPNDAALVQSTLAADGITCATTCMSSRDDFMAALEHGGIDLILSDFTLPAFDGLSALKIARAERPGLPVIMVSGTLGEERAVDSLKSGATDYVLKERLTRLAPAERRAMLEGETRAENKHFPKGDENGLVLNMDTNGCSRAARFAAKLAKPAISRWFAAVSGETPYGVNTP